MITCTDKGRNKPVCVPRFFLGKAELFGSKLTISVQWSDSAANAEATVYGRIKRHFYHFNPAFIIFGNQHFVLFGQYHRIRVQHQHIRSESLFFTVQFLDLDFLPALQRFGELLDKFRIVGQQTRG